MILQLIEKIEEKKENSDIKSIDISFIRNIRSFIDNWLNGIKHLDAKKRGNPKYLYGDYAEDLIKFVIKFEEYLKVEKGYYGSSTGRRDIRDLVKKELVKFRTIDFDKLSTESYDIDNSIKDGSLSQSQANSLMYNKSKKALKSLFKVLNYLGNKKQDTDYGRLEQKFAIGSVNIYIKLPSFNRYSTDNVKYDVKESIDALVQSALKARQLLKNVKLDVVWYGDMYAVPSGDTGSYELNFKSKESAAIYERKKDIVLLIFDYEAGPISISSERYAYSIIHELGHRYWYKFLRNEQKDKFEKWFSKIKSVSDYGNISPKEDFAETFAHYVLNEEMTKEQRERFIQIALTSGSGYKEKVECKRQCVGMKTSVLITRLEEASMDATTRRKFEKRVAQ